MTILMSSQMLCVDSNKRQGRPARQVFCFLHNPVNPLKLIRQAADEVDGVYIADCPGIENEWYCSRALEWTFGYNQGRLWGSLDLGSWDAILRSDIQVSMSRIFANEPIPFTWKGRERDTGEMRLDTKYQCGTIQFSRVHAQGLIQGPGLGQCEFSLVMDRKGVARWEVESWSNEWIVTTKTTTNMSVSTVGDDGQSDQGRSVLGVSPIFAVISVSRILFGFILLVEVSNASRLIGRDHVPKFRMKRPLIQNRFG